MDIISYIFYILAYSSMTGIVLLLLRRPMYVVYSLVTTRGSLTKFLIMLAGVMLIFSLIYYHGFFHNAGIVYNIDAPQISYNIFSDKAVAKIGEKYYGEEYYKEKHDRQDGRLIPDDTRLDSTLLHAPSPCCYNRKLDKDGNCVIAPDSTMLNPAHNRKIQENNKDILTLDSTVPDSTLLAVEGRYHNGKLNNEERRVYKRVTYMFIASNTIETTLEQGATDFFNHVMADYKKENIAKKRLFRYVVLFHILISWIFLGVFISMLYQKFRNE